MLIVCCDAICIPNLRSPRWFPRGGGAADGEVTASPIGDRRRRGVEPPEPKPAGRARLNTNWSGDSEDFASNDVTAEARESDGLRWSAEVAIGPYGALIFSQDGGGKPAA
jgi:hypothetical protein